MRVSFFISVIGLFVASSFCQDKVAKPTYADLVAKVKAGDKTVDFRLLRIAYADSSGGPDTDKQRKAMTAALNAKSYEEALKNADVVLEGNYTDMDAHFAE